MRTVTSSTAYLGFPLIAAILILLAGSTASADDPLWTELTKGKKSGKGAPVRVAAFATLAEGLSPTVVNIKVRRRAAPRSRQLEEGAGTGFIINEKGYILTNNHVVEKTVSIRVTTKDETDYAAKLIGADPLTDLALLKIEAESPLTVAPLGDSDNLRIGEWVIAIGNPLGLDHTVTAGIVSAKGRDLPQRSNDSPLQDDEPPYYADFIQTDASINRGNSGGPLINMSGEVVGINTLVAAAGQGIGFAIPVNMVKRLIPQLAAGRVRRSYLGVGIQAVTSTHAESLQLPAARGVLVGQVNPDSPALQAGVVAGDVILKFDGHIIKDMEDLIWLAASAGIGASVEMKVLREGREKTLKVVMGSIPEEGVEQAVDPADKGGFIAGVGLAVADLTREQRKAEKLPHKKGVRVTAVARGSAAWDERIRPGDVILQFGFAAATNVKALQRMCDRLEPGRSLSLLVKRGNRTFWVSLRKR